jgi:hypothetical protein
MMNFQKIQEIIQKTIIFKDSAKQIIQEISFGSFLIKLNKDTILI